MAGIAKQTIAQMMGLDKSDKLKALRRCGGEWYAEVEVKRPGRCPLCNRRKPWFHAHGSPRDVKHCKMPGGTWIHLRFVADRYKCSKCKRTFTALPSLCMRWQRLSESACLQMVSDVGSRSFNAVSKEYGIHVRTLLNMFRNWLKVDTDWEAFRDGRPIRLIVDEHSFSGRDMVLTVADRVRRRIIAILPDARKNTLKNYLKGLPIDIRGKINAAATDMCPRYRNAIKEVLGLTSAADPFHVLRDAHHRMDDIRLVEQVVLGQETGQEVKIPRLLLFKDPAKLRPKSKRRLRQVLLNHPIISVYYSFKERIRLLFKTRSHRHAEKLLDSIIADLKNTRYDPDLHRWARTLENWRDNIIAFFKTGMTTALVEGYHNVIKLNKRISFGFKSKEIYIKKMLLALVPARIEILHTY